MALSIYVLISRQSFDWDLTNAGRLLPALRRRATFLPWTMKIC